MKLRILSLLSLLIFVGCATFTQLKPKPELIQKEGSFIELKDDDKNFTLKPGESYFVSFPGPEADNFYLVIKTPNKKSFVGSLTNSLIKKKTPGQKIADETPDPESIYAFPIDTKDSLYYFLLENIAQESEVKLDYRYVPRWRYKFENGYAGLKKRYEDNIQDPKNYNELGTAFHFNDFPYAPTIGRMNAQIKDLNAILKELLDIEGLFPSNIKNSNDKAYLNFKNLKSAIEKEIAFQENYLATVKMFKDEYETRGTPAELLKRIDNFIAFFQLKDKTAANVLNEAKDVISKRFGEVVPFFDQRLSGKADAKPFDRKLYLLDEFNKIKTLYETADISLPQKYAALALYVNDFDKKTLAFDGAKNKITEINKAIADLKDMPDDNFFNKIKTDAATLKGSMPQKVDGRYGPYINYKCSQMFNAELDSFNLELDKYSKQYDLASALVPQLNSLKKMADYKGMLQLLIDNRDLDFLVAKYAALDRMSVDEQAKNIIDALEEYRFRASENGLKELYRDQTYLEAAKVMPYKQQRVRNLEDSLYMGIDRITRSRVNKFLEENIDTLENIDSLYEDSVFLPVYDVTFSTGSNAALLQKKEQLVADLAKMKENEFPMKAVKILYERFLKDPTGLGVTMARAIVTHGKHYTGDDKKTKRRIAECDPWRSKWIVKTKQYRNVFALPLTSNEKGTNRYFLRLNIRIPTDAKFPVYDVNIKLPKEIAKNAGTSQWYEKIKLNKKELKNEGRFTISSPSAESNYECQITPVRMDKDGNNYLDIYFTAKTFKVYQVGVMVQKPIIKKN